MRIGSYTHANSPFDVRAWLVPYHHRLIRLDACAAERGLEGERMGFFDPYLQGRDGEIDVTGKLQIAQQVGTAHVHVRYQAQGQPTPSQFY